MHLISADQIDLKPLFVPSGPNDPMLFATLEGRYPGDAVVDDLVAPTQCVLRIHFGMAFVSDKASDLFLREAVTRLRTPESRLT